MAHHEEYLYISANSLTDKRSVHIVVYEWQSFSRVKSRIWWWSMYPRKCYKIVLHSHTMPPPSTITLISHHSAPCHQHTSVVCQTPPRDKHINGGGSRLVWDTSEQLAFVLDPAYLCPPHPHSSLCGNNDFSTSRQGALPSDTLHCHPCHLME